MDLRRVEGGGEGDQNMFVLDRVLPSWHKLGSFEKRKLQLKQCLYQIAMSASLLETYS